MRIELKVPDIGEADKIEFLGWKVNVGENFVKGQELCELITDKAAFSLEAPEEGRLSEILAKSGDTVHVGQVVGYAEVKD